MRRLLGTSVLTVMVVVAVAMGATVALADSVASEGRRHPTDEWSPPSPEPSGIAYLHDGSYLVVDTNHNDEDGLNGWVMNPNTGAGTNVDVHVDGDDSTGVDYDPDANRLFVSSDGGFIMVVDNYRTISENPFEFDTGDFSGDTEDPAYDRDADILYWVDGAAGSIFWIDPGPDGDFNTGDDSPIGAVSLDSLDGDDWEALAWDPESGNLLVAARDGNVIYEVTIDGGVLNVQGEIDLSEVNLPNDIAGMGAGESADSLWVTSRLSSEVLELHYNGTTSTTSTTTSTTPTTQPTTTTSTTQPSSTTSTTQPGGTTTTTTTPGGGGTTPTTQPGGTTTTTTPGGGGTTPTTQPGNPGPGPGQGDPEFNDTAGNTFEEDIIWLASEGITKGCNPPANDEFCPDDFVTRGQMAAFLVRAFGYADVGTADYFIDTTGNTFETDIDKLRVAGVTQGCNPPTNNEYCPDDLVTRGQMAAFLVRAFGYTDVGTADYFIDTAGNTFETDIDKLRVAGVTQGCNPPTNDQYCPNDFVTRGQMAAFLRRGFGE